MPKPFTTPDHDVAEQSKVREQTDHGWNVIVWNDPINLTSYVVYVFQRVLGFTESKAEKHMLEVHEQGRSCVATESRERAELYWQRLQQFGLRTTIEKAA